MTAIAIGWRVPESAPRPSATGIAAITVVTEGIRIGRSRDRSESASHASPVQRSELLRLAATGCAGVRVRRLANGKVRITLASFRP